MGTRKSCKHDPCAQDRQRCGRGRVAVASSERLKRGGKPDAYETRDDVFRARTCPGHIEPRTAQRDQARASSISTTMWRHCPWRKRTMLSTQRATWPARMASQMSIASSVDVCWITKQMPSGMSICETIEM